ncbi:putative Ribosome quality control complex subunit NEMF [Blattamonas nauphoetae]|uniref:Ribosome quality control complex subunit NEMF n=1 Tax=Blattamonas nauphoetae TaxID=2049346 RepID=A0ABQ9XD19_9EUKA|nr:putative Ribosome quality control complex subunit NEMF [Blattamonas nauphoetae]
MKTRFSFLDTVIEAGSLRFLIGKRLNNIYEITPTLLLLKFSQETEKSFVLIESGKRVHSTIFTREIREKRSQFLQNCRKYIKTRKLEQVIQVGVDRIVCLVFGQGENQHNLIVELYTPGNILITDHTHRILCILQPKPEASPPQIVGSVYDIMAARQHETMSPQLIYRNLFNSVTSALQKQEQAHQTEPTPQKGKDTKQKGKGGKQQQPQQQKKRKEQPITLMSCLLSTLEYGRDIIDHVLCQLKYSPNTPLVLPSANEQISEESNAFVVTEDALFVHALSDKFLQAEALLHQRASEQGKGYILFKYVKQTDESKEPGLRQQFEDFFPLLLSHTAAQVGRASNPPKEGDFGVMEFDTFDQTLDTYFSTIEEKQDAQNKDTQEQSAMTRLKSIEDGQKQRLEEIEYRIEENRIKGEMVQMLSTQFQACLDVVNALIAQGHDWGMIERLLKQHAKMGDFTSKQIKKIHFKTNEIDVEIDNGDGEEDVPEPEPEEVEPQRRKKKKNQEAPNQPKLSVEERVQKLTTSKILVRLDLSLSAQANSRKFFDQMRELQNDLKKARAGAVQAIKAAREKAEIKVQKATEVKEKQMKKVRRRFWFEKFDWFVTSDGFLVLCGRDATTNEMIVKRYMKEDDIYVHANIAGAASLLIKGKKGIHAGLSENECGIPPRTILEAGVMAAAHTKGWSKGVMDVGAWWVRPNQVKVAAPTGQFMGKGSFLVVGKHHDIAINSTEMGFALLFMIDEESVKRRKERGERLICAYTDDDDEVEDQTGAEELPAIEDQPEEEKGDNDEGDGKDEKEDEKLSPEPEEDEEPTPSPKEEDPTPSPKEEDPTPSPKEDESPQPTPEKDNESEEDESESEEEEEEKEEQMEQSSSESDILSNVPAEQLIALGMPNPKKGKHIMVPKPTQKLKRGQKGKYKKMREKYGEQDEEERQLRMELIHGRADTSLPQFLRDEEERKQAKLSKEPKKDDRKERKGCKKGNTKGKKTEKVAEPTPEPAPPVKFTSFYGQTELTQTDSLDPATELVCFYCKEKGHKKSDCPSLKKDQLSGKVKASNDTTPQSSIDTALSQISALVCDPSPEDEIIAAIPTVVPYTVARTYKYFVKMVPGPKKPGRVAKESVDLFMAHPDATEAELKCIKALDDTELVQQMIGPVKIDNPELAKALAKKNEREKQMKKKKALELQKVMIEMK